MFYNYCSSRSCQAKDWPKHKKTCSGTTQTATTPAESITCTDQASLHTTSAAKDTRQTGQGPCQGNAKSKHEKDIWVADSVNVETKPEKLIVKEDQGVKIKYQPRIDFDGAARKLSEKQILKQNYKTEPKIQSDRTEINGATKCLETNRLSDSSAVENPCDVKGPTYLCGNKICSDVPSIDPLFPTVTITVKYNKVSTLFRAVMT